MRSPHFVTIAVRKPNEAIVLRNQSYESWGHRYPVFKRPILRGICSLVESMFQGIDALSYSAQVLAGGEDSNQKLSNWSIAVSILVAFAMGMGLFVALPHFLTAVLTSGQYLNLTAESPIFHLIDGFLKIAILLVYVSAISLMKDIRRVFQYHGAEHKSIYTFEAGQELTVENARKFTTLHPRCGTSFLLFLVLISIAVFSIVFPLFQLTHLSSNPILNHLCMVLLKILLMFPVAGLAYEFIKFCAFRMQSRLFRILIWPGLILQKLTTREPTDDQLEVALASLKYVIHMEESQGRKSPSFKEELEIASLQELGEIKSRVGQFLEA